MQEVEDLLDQNCSNLQLEQNAALDIVELEPGMLVKCIDAYVEIRKGDVGAVIQVQSLFLCYYNNSKYRFWD